MAKIEEETKAKIEKGLQIRFFDGEIDTTPEEKDKTKKKIIAFKYPRIVFPWSRAGKDVDGKEVSGAVPSLSEVLTFLQKESITTEIVLKDDAPDSQSVVQLLVDGWNRYANQLARVKAENTPASAKQKAISVYAKTLGISLTEAEKQLFG